ncbi:hypothetical protein G7Y89_g3396 [Cudoniella acicularis]|uniref:Trichothecene 3-O-acetyltransferase-like N-terminal domain-containing protein n=1 Tax=Cudoniella acicularis TaxID=354080 RepID=A0A8H4RSR5_9HELO|nr:hypothetical protein G7Y89_g3396 [Cudoniella acicularis]
MSTTTFKLHPLDQIAPRCYIRGLLCFPLLNEGSDRCIEALQASLDVTVAQSPFLSGTLQFESQSTGRLQLTFPTNGVKKKLKVKRFPDFGHSYEQLHDLGMPMRFFPLEFGPFDIMRPDLSSPVEVFGVQANLIPGGLILAIYAYHALVDGIGYGNITTQLAHNCFFGFRSQYRIVWKGGHTYENTLLSDIPGYPVYKILPTVPNGAVPMPVVSKQVRTFVFSKSSISRLKSLLVAHLPDEAQSTSTWISTYDSILALLWSSITLARLKSGNPDPLSLSSSTSPITSQLIYPTDTRKILRLPKLYCHNAGIRTLTPPIPVHDFTLTVAESLSKVALNVRKSTDSITETRARQVISLANSLPDVRALQRPPGVDIGLSVSAVLKLEKMETSTSYLVTGANRGLGRGLVEALLLLPNTIVVAATRDGNITDATNLNQVAIAQGNKLIVVKIDSLSETDPFQAANILQVEHGLKKIDVVIANAGISKYQGKALETPDKELYDHFATNTVGPLVLFQATWPLLQTSDSPRFVVISSIVASLAEVPSYPLYNSAYGASKAAVNFLLRKINFENPKLIAFPIHPGWIQSDMGNSAALRVGMTQAPIPIPESVKGVLRQIEVAAKSPNNVFVSFDGQIIPW